MSTGRCLRLPSAEEEHQFTGDRCAEQSRPAPESEANWVILTSEITLSAQAALTHRRVRGIGLLSDISNWLSSRQLLSCDQG